jgi:protein-disulfide isomerase
MPLRIPVSDKDHIHGSPDAPIELLQYGDYQCPFCWKAYPIVKDLQRQLGDRLRFVFRNFPLTKVHPHAKIAAMASEAADQQGKYWEMHDMLYQHHKRLNYDSLVEHAGKLELDIPRFEKDMQNKELDEKIEADFYYGLRSGVNATPTFFINGEKYLDPWDNNNLLEFIWMSGLLK